MANNPVLLVHGGAWAIPDELVDAHLKGVRKAMAEGWHVLEGGGSSVEAAEAAIIVMEDDDTFDAGRGSFLNRDGRVQLDAMIMDGATLRAGGVGCVERIRNAVRAARKVLEESPHVYLVAEGAERFAALHGIPLIDNSELVVEREVQHLRRAKETIARGESHEIFASEEIASDTVGTVALDQHGNLAAATSTGGTLNKTPGRVGDSSLIGCGCYADNESGAVSTTGWGEPMMKLVLGKWATDQIRCGLTPQEAASAAIEYLKRRLNGHGGMILLDREGRNGIAHNTPRMAWGLRTSSDEEWGIKK
ncbi:MAG TPA: isoaspartyl peptidase/L-asparaginase [Terriglobales bacterium]|nr:isoaspartyl peptidase/L-asparaginase [Terriglobales bacterium]